MAIFDTSGIADIMAEIMRLGEDSENVTDEMLLAGAEILKKEWRKKALKYEHYDTYAMVNNITNSKILIARDGTRKIKIYSEGGTSPTNTAKAFYTNYGDSYFSGSHWVSEATAESREEIYMKFDEILQRHI